MSETTKRIEEIAKELFLISPYNEKTWENLHPSDKIFWIKAATHLHQEVIRHEIEVLKREMTCENEFRFKTLIKDLERQIEETPDER